MTMMEQDKLKSGLEEVIKRTFNVIDNVYSENKPKDKPDSRLIFPQKRDKTKRVSEQELRFIFVDQFIKYCSDKNNKFDYYYSVEAPTQYVYHFYRDDRDDDKEPEFSVKKEKGDGKESASIDLAIYEKKTDSVNPVAIIEFKKDGCSAHEIAKDFLKLSVEPSSNEMLRYFIMISSSDTRLEKKNGGLLKSFENKLDKPCFHFHTSESIQWNQIDILWHRLPSDGEPIRNKEEKTPIDSNDFSAIYTHNGKNGILQDIKITPIQK